LHQVLRTFSMCRGVTGGGDSGGSSPLRFFARVQRILPVPVGETARLVQAQAEALFPGQRMAVPMREARVVSSCIENPVKFAKPLDITSPRGKLAASSGVFFLVQIGLSMSWISSEATIQR